ncbi:FAT-domain-containing protein [Gyrodon lividus]|nr:FAT-domain-containing protein [Gyrodon lividus]
MDNIPQLGTAADLEIRAARIADPGIDLRTKQTVACELREMIDTVRDTDSARVFPQMIPVLLEILRSGEPAYNKDNQEYQFRRVLLEVLHRIPYNDSIRPLALPLLSGMLHTLRHDNEENGVTSCKIIIDLLRSFRALTEELVSEFMAILQDVFRNIQDLVEETLSEDSAVLDVNVVMPSIRSFKVLAEMGMVVVTFSQSHRPLVVTMIQTTLALNFEVLALESPAQRKAREDREAMGAYWAGMAPSIKNPQAYADFINAQIKMVSYVAYIIRGFGEQFDSFGERLILSAVRLLQDLPANGIQARKDLMVVLRHLIGTPHRKALLPQIDKLFNEQILLGSGVGSRETLRPSAYAAIADLVHHVRTELSPDQLARVAKLYSALIHNPYLGHNLHTLFAKMMFGLIENITTKDTPQGAARVLGAMFETCVDKVDAMTNVLDNAFERLERAKAGDESPSPSLVVEKARPVAAAVYAVEKPEEVIHECRLLFRTLLHGFRVCLVGLKKCDGPIPDGTLVFRLFTSCIKCMALFDAEPREATEVMDWFSSVLLEVNLHVFQEVWTHKIELFFQAAQKRPTLLHICQILFSREPVSPTLVAIVLRFLIDRLHMLGEYDDQTAVVTIRLFKMAFSAVTTFPSTNEPILASHLAKLIMDCFPLAAKATKATNYFHLLRGLFRAIGGGGGRFELLYKEVLPLLPEMLESLNRQLLASDGYSRDMIVELCLTVPLRLTHLLPHLSYLMHPLALALRGTPELVSQGLRTLELCIDNLTPDFLDPTLSTVLRELMEALHSHLKPLPASHHHAHTTIRILGKLGGRNRRLLSKEPLLEFKPFSAPAKVVLSLGGTSERVELNAMSGLAARTLARAGPPHRACAYTFLETCVTSLLHENTHNEDQAAVFVRSLEAIFGAIYIPELKEYAQKFIRELSRAVFAMEMRKNATKEIALKRYPSPLLSSYLEAMPWVLAREKQEEAKPGQDLISLIISDLVAMGKEQGVTPLDIVPMLHQIASRFSAICLDDAWVRKSAGCSGIRIMTYTADFGVKWIQDREVDFVRTLLHILKDLPYDLPRDVGDVVDVLKRVLRVGSAETEGLTEAPIASRTKLVHLVGIFSSELSSPNPVVRQAVQTCIESLVELTGKSAHDLLLPHRDRMLTAIYTKPLRALSFPIQIGIIDAVRFCISLDPPLPELNDELLRLLHETLALADADDLNIGRVNLRQGGLEVIKLRVACIKLLTASMPMTDFFSKQHQTRQRVTSVYFKSLYSPSQEVKEVAHEGLRMVLTHQSRLPKELLQTGLRPILMNLADPKRLSVSGLEGLARLLELLINYFKVEIGHKLLDHFRIVADPQMLQASSRLPLPENEGITKLVRLANIFHLLPSAANIFLENLVNAIVQTEAQMHFSGRSPFSEPLGKYLDRYPGEALDFFIRHLHFPRHVRTFRSILQARLAPNLERELASRTQSLVAHCLKSNDQTLLLPGLYLLDDLADLQPSWISENDYMIDAVIEIWKSEPEQTDVMVPDAIHRQSTILSIFQRALEKTPRVDLLFEAVAIYTRNLAMDLTRLTQFLYRHVALNEDLFYRRNVLARFLIWFEDQSASWATKTYFIRLIVTPTILIQADKTSKDGLLDMDFITAVHRTIWQPMIDDTTFAEADDMFKIELLHLTTVMVHRFPELLEDVKKDIIRCAWHYITSDDAVVKQTAYLLAARFFEAFDTPQKFILSAWTGLLRPPHTEGKLLIKQALDILAPALPKSGANDVGYPQWAKTTRRLLAEEGNGFQQIIMIYQLLVRQPHLFYPVRALFIPHMVNSLNKLGLSGTASGESRILSIDISQVIFNWEQKPQDTDTQSSEVPSLAWVTPLAFRESIVSFLVRLATATLDQPVKSVLVPRALALLQQMVASSGWSDVTVKLNYFSRALEQIDLDSEAHLNQALSAGKVLQIVATDKDDSWYIANATILQSLMRKGLVTDEPGLHDALHPIFEHLLRLFPLPDRDEKQNDMSDFHNFVYSAIEDGLANTSALRGTLLMLKSVVQVSAERVQPFSASLLRLFTKLAKDHVNSAPSTSGFENGVRLITSIIEICKATIPYLGDQRKAFFGAFTALTEKSKSLALCRYMLDVMREWALARNETYPTMKDKVNVLQKMAGFESRGEPLFHDYLELIFDIYTEPSLRRSDLTSRLEQCFLLGCHARDPTLRERFMDLLDASVPRSPSNRLSYILGVQSWEPLADQNWIFLALHLLLGSVDTEIPLVPERKFTPEPGVGYLATRQKAASIVRPMQHLMFLDPHAAHDAWISIFSATWRCLSRREQADVTLHMINLLSKDYHIKQADMRPNVIQTLLSGVLACSPPMTLPPHLVKFLAKTYGAWHVSLEILEQSLECVRDDDASVRDTIYDSLTDVYAELAEEDMFYGLWRRRCLHLETNIGLAFEQHGMWEQAASTYELAQTRSKNGSIAFSEAEYCLWEDHWMLSAEKLQQWDTLHELARSEGNQELMLESAWRIKDWTEHRETLEDQINQLPDIATPRRRVFEAFIALLKLPAALDKNTEFTKILEDAMQLSLRKWVALPLHLSAAHVPLLQHFQQFVELQEAVQIFGSLSTTNAQNLEKKSSDLKMVLQAWRERLPNLQDGISIWSDLVAWRQNVFNAINKAYIPLISNNNQSGSAASTNVNTSGYRGYHETAWIINRFAHVARKHDLLDVCFSSLNKIYTLPNIEISEAFLKLREQARCHYQKPNDLQAGLEVINNTNLMYFSHSQKAEFFTLKGMFHARSGRNEEANHAFGQAVQMDMMQAKAWAEWGRYSDRMFKEFPTDMSHAANAVSCYLQAAGQYKNGKSRPLLTRVLWLLSVDDGNFTISRAFDTYKGEAAFWYWISLIPQLCLSINQREVKQARYILLNLAKLFPQALFFPLRTTKEDMAFVKKQAAVAASAARALQASQAVALNGVKRADGDQTMQDATAEVAGEIAKRENTAAEVNGSQRPTSQPTTTHADASSSNPAVAPLSLPAQHPASEVQPAYTVRQGWEHVDEVVQILKTAFPLLILSMETMVDQILQRFKAPPEEEIYRLIGMLLQDAIQNYVMRTNTPEDDGQLAPHTISNLTKMAANLSGAARKEYEEDFLKSRPTHYEYIRRLQRWRDRQEKYLDSRPRIQSLDLLSHYLTEFQYGKFDDIEVPGQYTEDKDSNQNFVHIQRFGPKFENCRSHGYCWRRFTVHGNDHSRTSFSVQLPSGRHCRREERVMQVFRIFNGALVRKKESRKRNLNFHIPAAISCSPNLRLLQNDSSYVTLGDIYDRHCEESGITREDPIIVSGEKVKSVLLDFKQANQRAPGKAEYFTLRKDIMDEVVTKLVPDDVLAKYMLNVMGGPADLWRMRKQFALQVAATSFMTYVFCLTSRSPSRFHVSRSTGRIAMSELLPGVAGQAPVFASNDAVPFRFTPNMQRFLGPVFTEGLLTSGIMVIGRCLTEPDFGLEQQLCLFARDEVMTWLHGRGQPWTFDISFRTNCAANIDGVVKRAEVMACKLERDQIGMVSAPPTVPVIQTVTNLISTATNPIQLMRMSEIYHPWF